MADAKITALTALSTVADEDLFVVVDDPSGTPVTKKATRSNVLGATGTFTPTVTGAGSGEASYNAQAGVYTRIGRLCHFQLRVAFTKGTISGAIRVGALPFTSSASSVQAAVSVGVFDEITFDDMVTSDVVGSATYCRLRTVTTGAADAAIGDVNLHATNEMIIALTGIYTVA